MIPASPFKRTVAILAGWSILSSVVLAADDLPWLDGYNVVWTTPSKHSGESMPVGGGDLGLNVWVENGDVLFYVGQSGCVDENGALLKHGRVRISLEPNPFGAGAEFRQELKLRQSCVEITGRADGAPKTTVRLWAEVHRPVVHVDVEAGEPVSACATFETRRYQDIFLDQGKSKFAQAGMAMMNRDGFPGEVWLYRDTIDSSMRRFVSTISTTGCERDSETERNWTITDTWSPRPTTRCSARCARPSTRGAARCWLIRGSTCPVPAPSPARPTGASGPARPIRA